MSTKRANIIISVCDRRGATCFLCGKEIVVNDALVLIKIFLHHPTPERTFTFFPAHRVCTVKLFDELRILLE